MVRPYIIGSKGRNLKAIIDKTGARVQLPKRDDLSQNDAEADPEEMVEIVIEGDVEGVNQARKDIESIVSERTSSTSLKVTSIPSDFYGLIGLHVKALEEGNDLKIKIPSVSYSEEVPLAITVSGEKSVVADTKTRLEALYEELKRTTIPTTLPIAKKQHRFIAEAIPEILSQSGCAVIVPPSSSSSDHITIRGPAANIGGGITLVMEKANSMSIDSLEISRAHPTASNQVHHAADITKYFRKLSKLDALEKQHSVRISVPSNKELLTATKIVYDFSGKSAANVSEARKNVIALVNGLPPARVLRVEIEPLLHRQVMGQKLKNVTNIRKQHNVEVCFPALEDNDSFVVLVHESADGSPDAHSAVSDAKQQIETLVAEAGTIATEKIDVPAKQHGLVMGKNNTTLNAITGGSDSVVRVLFGEPDQNSILVKGPKADVSRVVKDIQGVLEDAHNTEVANSHKIEFQFPAQFTKNLIGKGGANISKIRDELGVRIDVGDEGKITVQGPQRNAEEAKSRITLLGDRLADETTFRLKIPAEFHGQIIGQGGKFVKRLEEKYQVQINFPRAGAEQPDDEEKPGKNEVTVKGGKKGATAARTEIMELFEYENEHSHSVTIEVLQRAVSQIVGKSGATINELKDETNTKIDIDRTDGEEKSPDALVSITIVGKKSQVEKAKASIMEINKEVEDTVTRTLNVDPVHHRNLIGSGGANLRDIVVKAGGPDEAGLRARMVRFPRAGVDSNEIVLKGPKKVIDKIAKSIEKIVGDVESQHSETLQIAKEQVRLIIGRGGSKKSELESKHKVTIDIPRAESIEGSEVPVKVLGTPEGVEAAITEINKLVKIPDSETVQVPRSLHRAIADGGAFIRRLKSDFKVLVDHDHHEIPKAQTKSPATSGAKNDSQARIDDEEESDAYPWLIVEIASSSETGDIPWVLKGEAAQITKAKKALATAVSQAQSQTHTGHLTVPSTKHRFIIGQGGSKINSIRDESGVKIDVPRNQNDEVIVLKGSKEGLEKARLLIIEATTTPSGGRRSYD